MKKISLKLNQEKKKEGLAKENFMKALSVLVVKRSSPFPKRSTGVPMS